MPVCLPLPCRSAVRALTLGTTVAAALAQETWRSDLYPEDWQPPRPTASFENDKLLQDFSYAGYRRGEVPVPDIRGPVFTVTDTAYGADPGGARDSSGAIQKAVDAAAAAGGGVVHLPAGRYRVSRPDDAPGAITIAAPGIVLRGDGVGKTFILNVSTQMRSRSIIAVIGPATGDWRRSTAATPITADLLGPTTVIPVADTSLFTPGMPVVLRGDMTEAWIREHREEAWLPAAGTGRIGTPMIHRNVVTVDPAGGAITIDIPTRYYFKQRDNVHVHLPSTDLLAGVGIEDLSIGNLQHPDLQGDFGSAAFQQRGTPAWDVHDSAAIRLTHTRDCWVRRVATFHPEGNTSTCHILSNGVMLNQSRNVTLDRCHFARPMYGGGGGNGYMYRLTNSSDVLVMDSIAEFNRHGFVLSSMGATGNVFFRCADIITGKQTGPAGDQRVGGTGSDHHMHFSHSNLICSSRADSSYWTASYRSYGTHKVTAAHSVYWNTRGEGDGAHVVRTDQSRYGYVIGTSGPRPDVQVGGSGGERILPVDHVEGIGRGETLEPQSLYVDQRRRRLGSERAEPFR